MVSHGSDGRKPTGLTSVKGVRNEWYVLTLIVLQQTAAGDVAEYGEEVVGLAFRGTRLDTVRPITDAVGSNSRKQCRETLDAPDVREESLLTKHFGGLQCALESDFPRHEFFLSGRFDDRPSQHIVADQVHAHFAKHDLHCLASQMIHLQHRLQRPQM